jgi:hypothetical protein
VRPTKQATEGPVTVPRSELSQPAVAAPPGALPAKYLGQVVVVQGPGALVSLVRIVNGSATCDCAGYAATKLACEHIAAAARLLRGATV